MRIYLPLIIIALLIIGGSAAAQSLGNYLQSGSNAIVRIEIIEPPAAIAASHTLWGELRQLLGIRQVARIKPDVGTKLIVQASAYASSPYQTDATPCVTAAGTRVRPGVVATNFLPLGTLLEINGQKFIVEDRMNSRYDGYFMDIWFPSTSTALDFGRKKLEVIIAGYGEPGQDIRGIEPNKQVATSENQPTFIDRVRNQLAAIGQLLGARNTADVNRHDIDCLSQN